MKKIGVLMLVVLTMSGCSKLGQLSKENFAVTPEPLEATDGKVLAVVGGRFPTNYMKKKAVITITPELRYEGGKAVGASQTFQGEKVQGNDAVVSYKYGGNFTLRSTFDYVPEMAQSELWLTFDAKNGKKAVQLNDVMIGTGTLATSTLLQRTALDANSATGHDAYQYAIQQSQNAEIKYLISQSLVRTSELKSVSVQDFVKTLRDIKADQKGFALEGIEVSAYASPDGKLDFNTRLAEAREKSAGAYVNSELKNIALDADVTGKYTAEDWDGFQEIVSKSNIQDKEIILRVLSMYPDPEEREQQIHNLSAAYTELAAEVLPALRRARLRVNYSLIGRSDDEIKQQFTDDASKLSVEELLYGATLVEDKTQQENFLKYAAEKYPDDYRAYNNLAQLALQNGDLEAAKSYLAKAGNDAQEVKSNQALVALAEGNTEQAEVLLGQATNVENYNEVLGNICIARGQYTKAAELLNGTNTNSSALAQLLSNDYLGAEKTLGTVKNANATTSYLKALVAARHGQTNDVVSHLSDAISKDSSLKERAAKDLEFVNFYNSTAFQNLVK